MPRLLGVRLEYEDGPAFWISVEMLRQLEAASEAVALLERAKNVAKQLLAYSK